MKKTNATLYIVDDDKDVAFSLNLLLKRFYQSTYILNHPKEILSQMATHPADVILLDMNYRKGFEDGKEGLYWLQEINEKFPNAEVVMLTAYGEIELAVESIKKGAFDFVLKPWNNEQLLSIVKNAVYKSRKSAQKTVTQKPEKQMVWGKSRTMKNLKNWIEKVAPTDANVLILGENGTGKYVLAKEIHNQSLRHKSPFVSVDLGSLSETLFESELFGHAKGAFTDAKQDKIGLFEAAKNGTVFLDEIGNLSFNLQSKLLSAIQNRNFARVGETTLRKLDARIVCATNAPIYENVKNKTFRQDLLFRINTLEVEIPPLRKRKEDLKILSRYFLNQWEEKYHKPDLVLSEESLNELQRYNWPGNIRELENVLERAVILCDKKINPKDLGISVENWMELESGNLNLGEMEIRLVQEALKRHEGNISLAAKDLGISRNALYRRMEKYNL